MNRHSILLANVRVPQLQIAPGKLAERAVEIGERISQPSPPVLRRLLPSRDLLTLLRRERNRRGIPSVLERRELAPIEPQAEACEADLHLDACNVLEVHDAPTMRAHELRIGIEGDLVTKILVQPEVAADSQKLVLVQEDTGARRALVNRHVRAPHRHFLGDEGCVVAWASSFTEAGHDRFLQFAHVRQNVVGHREGYGRFFQPQSRAGTCPTPAYPYMLGRTGALGFFPASA